MFLPSKSGLHLSSFVASTLLISCVGFAFPGFSQEATSETPEAANPVAELPDEPEEKNAGGQAVTQAPTESVHQIPNRAPQAEIESAGYESEVQGRAAATEVVPAASSASVPNAPVASGALAPDAGWEILEQPRKIESQKAPLASQQVRAGIQSPFSNESLRTIAARHNLALPLPQGRIVIDKSERRLDIYNGNTRIKSYRVALGSRPTGHKVKQGDGRTPEGDFYICTRNAKTSAFHIFLGLSYPALPDAKRAVNSKQITWREYQIIHQRLASRGRPPWETNLGGWVGIHGGTDASFAQKKKRERGTSDWTAGCIALTNREIEEIHAATRLGTPVKVQP